MPKIGEHLADQTKTTGECAEYLTTAVVGADKVVLLDVYEAKDVTDLRDRFKAVLLFGPQGGVPRSGSSGVLLRFHARPAVVIFRGALAEGRQMGGRGNGRGAAVPLGDGLSVPGGVVHHTIHSFRPGYPCDGPRYQRERAAVSLSPNSRAPMVVKDGVDGAWLLSEPTEDSVLGTDVTSFLNRSSVIGLHGPCLLNGVCGRAEWVRHDETVQYDQDRPGLLRRLSRTDMLNTCKGCGDDNSDSVLDGLVTPRGTPAVDTCDAWILGIETDAHGEVIRAFPEAIKFWKEEGELVKQQRAARDNRTRGRGRGNG